MTCCDKKRAGKRRDPLASLAEKRMSESGSNDQKGKAYHPHHGDLAVFVLPAPQNDCNDAEGDYQPEQQHMEGFLSEYARAQRRKNCQ